jgi:nitrate reductase NapE component
MSPDRRLFIFALLAFVFFGLLGVIYVGLFGFPVAGSIIAANVAPPAPANTSTPSPTFPPIPTRTPTLTPTPTTPRTQTPSPTPSPTFILANNLVANFGPSYYPPGINPLTGLQVTDPALLARRPMAIKITNFPRRVRPQNGLNLADLVFEYYIEDSLTRFITVFYGNDAAQVGPVRSGRFFDEHIVRMYNAIFVFASADRRVLDTWLESDLLPRLVIPRSGNCPPLCRDEDNPDYNNLYADTAALGPYVVGRGGDNNQYDLSGMRFQSIVPWGGDLGLDVFVRYSRLDYNHWQYNAGMGLYERYQETADDTGQGESYALMYDGLTGEPVHAANVVVLFAHHQQYLDSVDTEIVQIDLTGFGEAYVFRDGRVYPALWQRTQTDQPLVLLRSQQSPSPFPLKPGNTFFQIISMGSNVAQESSSWRFTFATPVPFPTETPEAEDN